MRIAIVCDKPDRIRNTVPIIRSGIKYCGDTCEVYNCPVVEDRFDAVIIVGTPVVGNTTRNLTFNAQPREKIFFFDNAPFTGKTSPNNIYRTLSYAGIKGQAKYPSRLPLVNRWEKIKRDLNLTEEKWQGNESNDIWILAHNEKSLTTTLNRPKYEVGQLADHVLSLGYNVSIKSHPNLPIYKNVSLDEIIASKPKLCMAWHTHAVGYMLLKGIPCVVLDEYSLFFKHCPNQLNEKLHFDRKPMFQEISWTQWSLQEYKNGIAWNTCRKLIK